VAFDVLSPRAVAEVWFAALTSGDIQTALSYLDPNVESINYRPVAGYNDAMPWIGTQHGPDAVFASFKVFVGVCRDRSSASRGSRTTFTTTWSRTTASTTWTTPAAGTR